MTKRKIKVLIKIIKITEATIVLEILYLLQGILINGCNIYAIIKEIKNGAKILETSTKNPVKINTKILQNIILFKIYLPSITLIKL